MSRSERDIEIIIQEAKKRGLSAEQTAYVLGTVEKETGNTFTVRRETYNNTPQSWFGNYGGGWQYHGRGYVQVTHDYNYRWAEKVLKEEFPDDSIPNLIEHPDFLYGGEKELYRTGIEAPDPDKLSQYHATLLIRGMMDGQYSPDGKGLDTYINDTTTDFYNARRTVNSGDKGTYLPISNMAQSWLQRLNERDYTNMRYVNPVTPTFNPSIPIERYEQGSEQSSIDWNNLVNTTEPPPPSQFDTLEQMNSEVDRFSLPDPTESIPTIENTLFGGVDLEEGSLNSPFTFGE